MEQYNKHRHFTLKRTDEYVLDLPDIPFDFFEPSKQADMSRTFRKTHYLMKQSSIQESNPSSDLSGPYKENGLNMATVSENEFDTQLDFSDLKTSSLEDNDGDLLFNKRLRMEQNRREDSAFCEVSSKTSVNCSSRLIRTPRVVTYDENNMTSRFLAYQERKVMSERQEPHTVTSICESKVRNTFSQSITITREYCLCDLMLAIKGAGLLMPYFNIGIDFTMSNITHGQRSYGGKSLHENTDINPYKEMICLLGVTMEELKRAEDGIRVFGIGRELFTIAPKNGQCKDFMDVLQVYEEALRREKLGGTSNFAPLIHEVIQCSKNTSCFQLLLILTDGQLTKQDESFDAIAEASNYPISICVIGVGDGPWVVMEDLGREHPRRKFDNYHFVNFQKHKEESNTIETEVAADILSKVPEQIEDVIRLGFMNNT